MAGVVTSDLIEQYASLYTSPEEDHLNTLNLETQASVPGSQMLSGHLQGLFLTMLSRMIQPESILELGTYTGYSAICLAKGLSKNGHLHTIDIDQKLQEIRNRYWTEAKLDDKITQHIGKAAEVINTIEGEFDLVFIDADKRNYELYFDMVIDRLSSKGWIIADNVLFHGEVVLPIEQQGKNAQFMHAFNQKIAAREDLEQIILPIRDGLMLIRKK